MLIQKQVLFQGHMLLYLGLNLEWLSSCNNANVCGGYKKNGIVQWLHTQCNTEQLHTKVKANSQHNRCYKQYRQSAGSLLLLTNEIWLNLTKWSPVRDIQQYPALGSQVKDIPNLSFLWLTKKYINRQTVIYIHISPDFTSNRIQTPGFDSQLRLDQYFGDLLFPGQKFNW